MRIGLIAMSGIRAENEELMNAGLTMPGVVERSRIVASLPSLSLLTLAALTPPEIEVEYHEIDDVRRRPDLPDGFDLVAIATFSAQVNDAYAVAARYRAQGVPVVMGGLHVTALPDEAQRHCDAVVVGEGELSWPTLVDDFRAGRLAKRYAPLPGQFFDLAAAPLPRFDLLDGLTPMPGRYNRITVQTSRGCPHLCDFCASSVLLTPRYAVKPVEKVIAEIRRIKQFWRRPFIEFADDNSFAHRAHCKALMRALIDERVHWFTEADISIADDPELLDLMRQAGCRQVLIGLESPSTRGLAGIEIKRNWKLRKHSTYAAAIHAIQSRGITVNGCFILGLDGDAEDVFDSIYDFVDRTALYDAQITVLTAFPGTPLYRRLKQEGRIIDDGAWSKCTLFDVNHVPLRMSPQRLQQGLLNLARRLYEPSFVEDRRRRFFAGVRHGAEMEAVRAAEAACTRP